MATRPRGRPGTEGVVTGDAVIATLDTAEDLATWKGKLKGKFVLSSAMPDVPASFDPLARRFTDDQLRDLERETDAAGRGGRGRAAGPGRAGGPGGGRGAGQSFAQTRTQFLKDEGVLAVVTAGRGDRRHGVRRRRHGQRAAERQPGVPAITIAVEHYGRLVRTIEKKMPVTIAAGHREHVHRRHRCRSTSSARFPGTDKADEVVMLGAHFDSWHGGTGATDNAAGSAVMMEAMRILKASGVRLRRTVRIGLWGGEEQGLLGSRAYVNETFANRADMALKPEHAKFAGYFNVDNGTGAIRGVYLRGTKASRRSSRPGWSRSTTSA